MAAQTAHTSLVHDKVERARHVLVELARGAVELTGALSKRPGAHHIQADGHCTIEHRTHVLSSRVAILGGLPHEPVDVGTDKAPRGAVEGELAASGADKGRARVGDGHE